MLPTHSSLSRSTLLLALSTVILAAVVGISASPTRVHADCVQSQTYPPQVVCSSNTDSTQGGGVVGTSPSGGTTTGTNNNGDYNATPGVTSSNPVTQAPASNLVAFWKFDETNGQAFDSSGNGNTGVLENGAARYVGTQQGNKLLLDGLNDRMSVPAISANASNLNSFTLIVWVRPSANGGIIVRKGNTSTGRFNFGVNAQGQLYLRAGYVTPGSWQTVSSLPLNAWSYVAVTYSFGTANDPVFYIGGQQAASSKTQAPSGDAVADTPYLYIGNNHDLVNRAADGLTSGFSGRMDLVRIYNTVLDASGVLSIKSPDPEAPDSYNPFTPVQMPNGTLIQPMTEGNAGAVSALHAQLQAILAQIATLQGTPSYNAVPGLSPRACPNIARALGRGSRGTDVSSLQQFLIQQNLLANDSATGYFGLMTEAALQKWQLQSNIVVSGSAATTGWGFLGPRTRAAIVAACK